MAPAIKRKALLPVLEAIAEALMPSQPDQASAARHEGKQDMANLYATSGKQQNLHMHQARQPCCCIMLIWQCSRAARFVPADSGSDGEEPHSGVPVRDILVCSC